MLQSECHQDLQSKKVSTFIYVIKFEPLIIKGNKMVFNINYNSFQSLAGSYSERENDKKERHTQIMFWLCCAKTSHLTL